MVPESGASPAPGQPPRECLLWLRSLNLDSRPTPQLLANGFLLAEIFSRYFPRISTSPTNKSRQMHRRSDTSSRSSNDIQPQRLRRRNAAGDATTRTPTLEFPFYSFTNGCGTTAKAENWALLRRFLERQFDLDLSENVIAMVSAGHRGLGWAIVCEVWQLMTGKPLHTRW
ncbi:hypothetical protein BC828DRAFT_157555 [Blastocladiella britannica]|nr:hypothetical protein BC828DRAFT_157555 [Blastocladiella britannica]